MPIRTIILTALLVSSWAAAADELVPTTTVDGPLPWRSQSSAYPLWLLPAEAATSQPSAATTPLVPLSVTYRQESWLSRVGSWSDNLRLTVWRNSDSRLTLGLSTSGLKFKLRGNGRGSESETETRRAHRQLLKTQSLFEDAVQRSRP